MLFHIILWIVGIGLGVLFGVVVVISLLSVMIADLWKWLRG